MARRPITTADRIRALPKPVMATGPVTTADRIRTAGQPVVTATQGQPTTVRRPSFKPFTPYKAPPIPTGLYDPSLDAARRAATRGLQDTTADAATQTQRDITDYGVGRDQIQLGQTRGTQDLTTELNQGNQAFDQQTQALARSYQQLQNRQGQQISAGGQSYGGAALQAAAKRAENQQIDQKPIDTARQQLADSVFLRGTRLNQDADLQRASLALDLGPVSADNPLGGRRAQDRATALLRAGREDTQFGIDTTAQKAFQAAGMNYVPPARGTPGGIPKNEHVGPNGGHTRDVRQGGFVFTIRPNGTVVRKRKA